MLAEAEMTQLGTRGGPSCQAFGWHALGDRGSGQRGHAAASRVSFWGGPSSAMDGSSTLGPRCSDQATHFMRQQSRPGSSSL